METILAFILGVTASYWVLIPALIFAIWAELSDNHVSSAMFTVVGLVSAYFIFNLSPLLLLAYLPTGYLWSAWRWKVYCKECLQKAKEGNLDLSNWREVEKIDKESNRRILAKLTSEKDNLDKIVSWIICFPASVIERCASDLIFIVKSFVTGWGSRLYKNTSANTLKEFDKD